MKAEPVSSRLVPFEEVLEQARRGVSSPLGLILARLVAPAREKRQPNFEQPYPTSSSCPASVKISKGRPPIEQHWLLPCAGRSAAGVEGRGASALRRRQGRRFPAPRSSPAQRRETSIQGCQAHHASLLGQRAARPQQVATTSTCLWTRHKAQIVIYCRLSKISPRLDILESVGTVSAN